MYKIGYEWGNLFKLRLCCCVVVKAIIIAIIFGVFFYGSVNKLKSKLHDIIGICMKGRLQLFSQQYAMTRNALKCNMDISDSKESVFGYSEQLGRKYRKVG